MKNKNTFSVFALIMLFLTFVMPFYHISADTDEEQYIINSSELYNTPIYIYDSENYKTNNQIRLTGFISNNSYFGAAYNYYSNSKLAFFKNGNIFIYLFARSTSNYNTYYGDVGMFSSSGSWQGGSFDKSAGSYTKEGNTVYWAVATHNSSQGLESASQFMNQSANNSYNDNFYKQVAYDMVYNAQEPAPPIQAGDLTFNYYTDFASTQSYSIGALKSNRDTITWEYNNTSTSNIPLLDLKVDIRAVPTNYYASTQDALNSLGWSDLHLDLSYASDLGSYQINNGSVSYTWEQVVNNFAVETNLPEWMETVMNFWSNGFYKIYNNLYYAAGWVYQIRLNTWSGDYTGEWQTIYTVPAAPPDGQQQTINYYVNGTGITEPIYQTIQNINNQNNITNNTWYVNGAPVDVDESSEGESWLEKLVKMIWNFITSIFQFNDTDLTIPDWDLNIQNLKDNTGIFGQSIRAIDQIKLRFDALQDAQPVFSFPGFSLDNVQLVPSFSVNLNDVVEDMGLEGLHNTELVIMDGVVYLSLILFAKAQLERILKK